MMKNRNLMVEVTPEEYKLLCKGAFELSLRPTEDLIDELIRRTTNKTYVETGNVDPVSFKPQSLVKGSLTYGNGELFTYSCVVIKKEE